MADQIILKGMRENNLKNIDLTLDKGQLIVFTGISGSGKSSVVFETLAKESLRQMTKNYSQYLRRHMTLYERPKADRMENLSPVVVVDQRPIGRNVESDIGSYMEVGPLVRLLYSRIGQPSVGSATDYSRKSSFGQCPDCAGNGLRIQADVNKLVDVDKSLRDYAVQFKPLSPAGWQGRWMMTGGIFDPDLPIKDYPEDLYNLFIYGPEDGGTVSMPFHTKNGPHDSKWDGLLPRFQRLYVDRDISKLKEVNEDDVLAVSSYEKCTSCQGTGINPKILESKIKGLNIAQVMQMELTNLRDFLQTIDDPLGQSIVGQIVPVIDRMISLGLGYLTLDRGLVGLSGGEAQRVKIARQLNSSLNNLTFIFDEPSAGLHPQELDQLTDMLKQLRDDHNTVIVVEHNPQIIRQADLVVEMGPGAGKDGGEIIFQGQAQDLTEQTPTGRALNRQLQVKDQVRPIEATFPVRQAQANNLKNISVDIPQSVLVDVVGVSGSGKTSLVIDVFAKDQEDQAIVVDQRPIGRSSRSNLATYMGIMDDIRQVFANETGQDPGLFSFNSLGACPDCQGKGELQPDVAFADPVSMVCQTCAGTRYSQEALSYSYQGRNIYETLQLTVREGLDYFNKASIRHRLQNLVNVGLDYLSLNQATNSLSGGELQRLKLASQLQHSGKIYILDEPASGLHPEDSQALLDLFNRLVDQGNTVVIIEHHLEFVAQADWIIELGPAGGQAGGEVIFQGRPKDLLEAETPTGKFLAKEVSRKDRR